jgi:acetylornithine deacetylase
VALEQLDGELQARPAHPLLGNGSLHASLIAGGTEISTYPARCRLQLERRTLPGETVASVAGEIAAILERLRAQDPQFRGEAEPTLFRPPLETAAAEPIVMALAGAAAAVLGAPPPLAGASFWMDAALLGAAGIPTAVFGPRGAGLHADVEWVDLASVQACADALAVAAQAFCD